MYNATGVGASSTPRAALSENCGAEGSRRLETRHSSAVQSLRFPIPGYIRTRCSGIASRGTAIIDAAGVITGGWSAITGAFMGSVRVKIDPRPVSYTHLTL